MITTLKLTGLSAIISAGLATGFTVPDGQVAPAPSAKIFYDRVGEATVTSPAQLASAKLARIDVNLGAKADRVRVSDEVRCTDGAWLFVPADCLPSFDPAAARTSELRVSSNISALVRDGGTHAVASR